MVLVFLTCHFILKWSPIFISYVMFISQIQVSNYWLKLLEETYLLISVVSFNLNKSLGIPVAKVFVWVSLTSCLDLINLVHVLLLQMHVLSIDNMVIGKLILFILLIILLSIFCFFFFFLYLVLLTIIFNWFCLIIFSNFHFFLSIFLGFLRFSIFLLIVTITVIVIIFFHVLILLRFLLLVSFVNFFLLTLTLRHS